MKPWYVTHVYSVTLIFLCDSVRYIEGSVSKLVEDNGTVVGVKYRRKGGDVTEVHWSVGFCFVNFRLILVLYFHH